MKNRDDSPYIWAALDGRDVADFGQLSPDQQSLVLMRAAQIQQTDRCAILLEGDYREPRFLGCTGISTQHQPKEKTMANAKKNGLSTVILSRKNARHIEKLKEYSELSGIPLHDLLDEALSEYLARPVETGKS
jgi:hypothetical protein